MLTMNKRTEIRHLPLVVRDNLAQVLATNWMDLMELIPKELNQNGEIVNSDPKYRTDDILLIKNHSSSDIDSVKILFEEWGTSGRIRPTLEHLLNILVQAQSYRAADYIAGQLLNEPVPERPSVGPAARVPIPLDEDDDDEDEDSSSTIRPTAPSNSSQLFDIVNRDSPSLYHKGYSDINKCQFIQNQQQNSVPSPTPNTQTTNEPYQSSTRSVPDMIEFSKSLNDNLPAFSNIMISTDNVVVDDSSMYMPAISDLIDDNTSSQSVVINSNQEMSKIVRHTTTLSLVTGDDFSNRYQPTTNDVNELTPPTTDSSYSSSDMIPNLSNFHSDRSDRLDTDIPLLSMLQNSSPTPVSSQLSNLATLQNIMRFDHNNLLRATNDFDGNKFVGVQSGGRKLGTGGFSDVYLGYNISDGIRYCAVKKLKRHHEKFREKFCREIEILSQHRHKHLVELIGYSINMDDLCLIYEFISGGNLQEKLENCRKRVESLDWRVRIQMANGIADGIRYLHSESVNIVHRDIKSANVLLENSVPKICDFGLIKPINSTSTTNASGTSPYMAPESIRGNVTTAVDIFAFGVIILELVTGLPVYDYSRKDPDLITHFETHSEDQNYEKVLMDRNAGDWGLPETDKYLLTMFKLACDCLKSKRNERLTIAEVHSIFQSIPIHN